MPWWAVAYLVLCGALSIAGFRRDLRDREPIWFMTLSRLSSVMGIHFIPGVAYPWIADYPGKSVPGMLLFCVIWDGMELDHEMRKLKADPDPELSDSEKRWLALLLPVLGAVLLAPAYACGALVCVRAFE